MMKYSTPTTQTIFDSILEATSSNQLLHIQCSDEFQSPLSCTRVFNFHRGSFSLKNLKPSDSTPLAYFLKNAQCSDITFELHSCSFDVREYEAVLEAFGDRQVSLKLREIDCPPLLNAIASIGVPGLTELSFAECCYVSDDEETVYGESSDDNALTNFPIEWMEQCPGLKKITFQEPYGVSDIMECLKYCFTLESLTFDGCNLKGDTMECLKHCPKLESLSFTDCEVNGDTVEGLKYCSNLKSLIICGEVDCPLDNSTYQVLEETLQHCSRLQQLEFSFTVMESTGMAHVAKGIAGCKELNELNLHDIYLHDDGVKFLVEALLVNCRDIKDVNLDTNYLTDNSVPCLIDLIKSARALERLVLVEQVDGDEWDNNFTPRRWSEMEEAVRSRTEDMSKLQLIGEPLLSDEESRNNSENEHEESVGSENNFNEQNQSNNSGRGFEELHENNYSENKGDQQQSHPPQQPLPQQLLPPPPLPQAQLPEPPLRQWAGLVGQGGPRALGRPVPNVPALSMYPAIYQRSIAQQKWQLEMAAATSGIYLMTPQTMESQNPMLLKQQQFMWQQPFPPPPPTLPEGPSHPGAIPPLGDGSLLGYPPQLPGMPVQGGLEQRPHYTSPSGLFIPSIPPDQQHRRQHTRQHEPRSQATPTVAVPPDTATTTAAVANIIYHH